MSASRRGGAERGLGRRRAAPRSSRASACATLVVERGSGRSPQEVKERLRELSDRFSGAQAINLRHQPIPWAYRVFFRHIGLDPDEQRTPVEELALERMKQRRLQSQNLLDDALTIAIVESGVAVRAFDADRVDGRARDPRRRRRARRSRAGPGELPAGTLVIADDERPLALLFGAHRPTGRGVDPETKRTLLVAIRVEGVPDDRRRGGALAGAPRCCAGVELAALDSASTP